MENLVPKGVMKDVVRNPLGIVALFISLIYALASLLLGVTLSSLTPIERVPLILFIVLFPCLVLWVFWKLVTKHHGKLYAPKDYQSDLSFLRTLSAEEKQEKLEQDVVDSLPDVQDAAPHNLNPVVLGEEHQSAVPATILPTPPNVSAFSANTRFSLGKLSADTVKLEAAGLATLVADFGPVLASDIGIANTGASFDAMLGTHAGSKVFAEVKVVRAPTRNAPLIDRVLYHAVLADKYFKGNFKLVLLIVFAFEKDQMSRYVTAWQRKVKQCPADVELRVVHQDELPSAGEGPAITQ